MSDHISEAIGSASSYLRDHPGEARYTDGAAIATVAEGLVVHVTGPNGEDATTDMVPSVGGTATAPSPGWLLRAAEASCVATLITMRAAVLELPIRDLRVTVDSESDDRGILGLDDSIPAGPLSGRVHVNLRAEGATREELTALVHWGVAHCPVTDAVERAVPLTVEVDLG